MISPLAFVDPSAKIGENVTIHPFAYIDKNVEIGNNNVIMPYASILNGARIGDGNTIYQGAVISAVPQDFNFKGEETIARIGNNNTIREYAVISRATHSDGETCIGDNNFIMQAVRLSHDVHVGNHVIVGNGSQISGDTTIEDHAILSSCVLMQQHTRVGQWALVQGGCRFNKDIPPYVVAAHEPTVYHGVNKLVLSNRGFSERILRHIASAYRLIFQASILNLNDALDKIRDQVPMSEEIENIIAFCENTKQGLIK